LRRSHPPIEESKGQTLFHFNVKTLFRITGKMNETDSAIVGKMYARAALILATGVALGIFIYAVRWW